MGPIELLKNRRFFPMFLTQFLGAFNDNFLKNALVILIAFKTTEVFGIPSSQMVAVAGGIFILPFFIFSATSGQIADKVDKAKLIGWVKISEIGIMILSSAGFITLNYGLLLFALFLMGLHSTFFGPVKYSILPQHLDKTDLVTANALIEAGTFLAILIGTIAGGVLIARDNGPMVVSIGLVVVAVLGWLTSLMIPSAPAIDTTIKVQWNPIPPTVDIYRFTKKNRTVYLSILGISWFWFFGAAMLSLFPPYCKEVLKANEHVVTLFLATFSIGIGVGSMLCGRFSKKRLELGLVPMGSIGITFFTFDLFFSALPESTGAVLGVMEFIRSIEGFHILLDLFFISIFAGFFIVPLYTLIQERSEESHRSRIIASNNILNAVFMVGSAVMILILMRIGFSIPQMFLVLSILNAAIALYLYTLIPEFLIRFLVWIAAHFMYRLKITGEEHLPPTGAALIVSNHVSFVDWLIIGAIVDRPVRFIMDHNFAKGIFMKRVLKRAKVIFISTAKEDPSMVQNAIHQAILELKEGEIVCIFPEGRITRDGHMNVFKPGVERIIEAAPVPVIPVALKGMWGSLFSREGGRAILKAPKRFRARVEVRIGKPIPSHEAKAGVLQAKVNELLNS